MAVTLTKIGKTPGQPQFGLDTFTEHHKADATADIVLTDASVPQKGDTHPDYPFMFLTDRHCAETGEKASSLDLVYMGCLNSADDAPVLPPQKHDDSDAIMSATSSRGKDGTTLTSPITVQYYGPTRTLAFITYNALGVRGTASDPTDDIRVVSYTVGDTAYSPTGLLAGVIDNFFSPLLIDTIDCSEIVATKFWQNTERKTKTLGPYIVTAVSGDYIGMYAPGQGYVVGNSLTITDGTHSAGIDVTAVGIGNSITNYTVTSNTFDYTTTGGPPFYASGGSGSGAGFYNIHVA